MQNDNSCYANKFAEQRFFAGNYADLRINAGGRGQLRWLMNVPRLQCVGSDYYSTMLPAIG
jgi:hypothetical protein